MQTLVLLYLPDTSVTLAGFILIVGGAVLLMSLIPTLHHLRRAVSQMAFLCCLVHSHSRIV